MTLKIKFKVTYISNIYSSERSSSDMLLLLTSMSHSGMWSPPIYHHIWPWVTLPGQAWGHSYFKPLSLRNRFWDRLLLNTNSYMESASHTIRFELEWPWKIKFKVNLFGLACVKVICYNQYMNFKLTCKNLKAWPNAIYMCSMIFEYLSWAQRPMAIF